MKILFLFLVVILMYSCKDRTEIHDNSKVKGLTDFRNYTGNALIFTDIRSIATNIIFIFPVDESDSNNFKIMDVINTINNKIVLLYFPGDWSELYYSLNQSVNKNIMYYKACNIPSDSLFYFRCFIKISNYNDLLDPFTNDYGDTIVDIHNDSCNVKLLMETDSSSFEIINIYQ